MKKLITSAVALMAVGFTYAQANLDVTTQLGNTNSAVVNQTGLMNYNNLLQDGNLNDATVDQFGAFNANLALSREIVITLM